jgi:spore coat polysaccharide biosynthesis protein SpsF
VKTVAITQARMGSTRLPGKVLLDLAGAPMLKRHVDRVRRSHTLDGVVVATTIRPADDAIVELCRQEGWLFFRGSEDDVLDRYYQAARAYRAEVVVRVTSDCPLIDPEIIDAVVNTLVRQRPSADYCNNDGPRRTFPRGLDTEAMSFAALARAWQEDRDRCWREHVSTFIRRRPDLFRSCYVTNDEDLSHMRWTVDTLEDLTFVRRIYGHFGHDRFSWREVVAALEDHPDWAEINSQVVQKEV